MLEKMQKEIGFTKVPMNHGDNGARFVNFLRFAVGESRIAASIRKDFNIGRNVDCTPEQALADFVDWLIVNYWGEASPEEVARHAKHRVIRIDPWISFHACSFAARLTKVTAIQTPIWQPQHDEYHSTTS